MNAEYKTFVYLAIVSRSCEVIILCILGKLMSEYENYLKEK